MSQGESALRLNPLQLAWLQELGIEAALLQRHAVPATSGTLANPSIAAAPVALSAARAPAPQDPPDLLNAARAAVAHKPAGAPPRTQALVPEPRAVPQRAVNLACQRYAPQDGAADCGQASTWMVVGEVPAAADAAQLLHAMLAAVRLQPVDPVVRLQVHAGLPQADGQARSILQVQIQNHVQTWQPACILALGRVAAGALLQTGDDIEFLRGKVWSCVGAAGNSIPVVVTYPPGWLLANSHHKAGVWRDLLLARAALSAPLRDA